MTPSLTVDLADLFARHERVHLSFSGGKDSIVLADLCKPWRVQVTLIWSNTGIMWPHMVQFVRAYASQFRLIEASPKQDFRAFWGEHGLPADVVPIENALGRRWPRLQSWTTCCWAMRTQPVLETLITECATAALHGQRLADGPLVQTHSGMWGPPAGIEVVGPLWDWSDDDVMTYIEENRLRLPEQYRASSSSLECAICPAHPGVGDELIAAGLSPTLARCARNLGDIVRAAASGALAKIERDSALIPPEDRPKRWAAAEPILAPALEYDIGERSIEEIRASFEGGALELFTAGRSALLAELIGLADGKVLHIYLAAGELGEVTNILRPQAELFARMNGATAAIIGGRRGWIRAWRQHGYSFLQKSGHRHSWMASKPFFSDASPATQRAA